MRLALHLGYANVDRMLRSMTGRQFEEWRLFFELEPFGNDVQEDLFASIVQILANVNRGKARRNRPFSLEEARMSFGDRGTDRKPKDSMILKGVAKAFMHGHEKAFAAEQARKKRKEQ